MKLSRAQQNELIVWEYFMPEDLKKVSRNDDDLKKFFEWSERGLHKEESSVGGIAGYSQNTYFKALREGKSWAGVHMEMYEEGILDGSMPYFVILGGYEWFGRKRWWQFWRWFSKDTYTPVPRPVVNFMKKEMFKGLDAEIIENCYRELNEHLL